MNEIHLQLCASEEWREIVEGQILPWALHEVELGDDVIEVGPGPGITTDVLRTRVEQLTAVEIDTALAAALAARLSGSNVEVLEADAADLPLPTDRFTGAVSFTMLHHVPTAALQDRLFAELGRVLAPGGVLVLSDSVASDDLRALHDGDTYNPIDPGTLPRRLEAAGFVGIDVRVHELGFAARARTA